MYECVYIYIYIYRYECDRGIAYSVCFLSMSSLLAQKHELIGGLSTQPLTQGHEAILEAPARARLQQPCAPGQLKSRTSPSLDCDGTS